LLGKHPQRARESEELVRVSLVGRHELFYQLEVSRRLDQAPPVRGALLRDADVVRDLVQPRRFELRRRAALEPAKRVHEGDLRRVLRLFAVAKLVLAEREDLPLMSLVEQARGFAFRLIQPEWSRCRMAFVRYCGHDLSPS